MVPSGEPKHPTAFPFRELTDAEFDELVYLLAHVSNPCVAKLHAPDGGLDTVCPVPSNPTTAGWGIQAKLHREQIKWTNCKESLDRAVANWRAPKVTFAFPRDLTVNQHRLFHKHLSGRHPGVAVDWWGETKLTALLLEGPAARGIAKRFFHSEDPAELADRAIRAGTPLRTAADLLQREEATGEFLRSADPHFDWVSTKRATTPGPVALAPGTAMRLEFGNEGHELIVDAVPRTPAAVEHFVQRARWSSPVPPIAIARSSSCNGSPRRAVGPISAKRWCASTVSRRHSMSFSARGSPDESAYVPTERPRRGRLTCRSIPTKGRRAGTST